MFQLLTLQLAMLALAGPQAEQRLGSVSGIVVRLGGNEPVSDVDVELTRLEGTAAYPLGPPVNPPSNFSAGALVARTAPNPADISNLRTRSDGLFNFKDLKPGVYRLLAARGDGTYFPAEYGQRHPRGRGFNFTLTEGQAMASVKLEMAPTGSISGRVIDADGVPAARVRVMALEAVYQSGQRVLGLVQATNTDDRGDYRLFWLPPGRYYIAARPEDPKAGSIPLVVTPPGRGPMRETFGQAPLMHRSLSNGEVVEETYELAYRGGGSDSQRAQALDLAPGANINGIDIPLAESRLRARRIRGVVIDGTTGQPAGSVFVRAIPSNPGPSVILPGSTTAANGSFEISGAGPGFRWRPAPPFPAALRSVTASRCARHGSGKEAATGGTIVANEKGGPYGWSSSPIASRTTARIPRAVGLAENETYLSVYYPGTPEPQSATLIDLHAGEEIRDVNVNLVAGPALRIRGTVTDPVTRQSAPNTTRVLLSPFSSPLATTTCALIGGAFQFGPLAPGVYEIRAEYARSGRAIMGRAIVELRNRDLDVNVQITGFNLSGRIISAGPTTGMQVILRSAPAFRIAGEISADGSFRIEGVPPGDYQVYVSSLEDAYVKTIQMGEADVLTRDLHIDAQPADQLQIVVAKDGGSVNGRVVNEQRGAVPNATVVLIPDGVRAPRLDQYKTASTGPSGEFLLGGIAPGAYNVFAWEDVDKDAWLDPNFLRLYRDFGRPVRVVEGANENIELRSIR